MATLEASSSGAARHLLPDGGNFERSCKAPIERCSEERPSGYTCGLWPEGRMRGLSQSDRSPVASLQARSLRLRTPHPALRATFSHKGRREEGPGLSVLETFHVRA